jgi:hypothetical protein
MAATEMGDKPMQRNSVEVPSLSRSISHRRPNVIREMCFEKQERYVEAFSVRLDLPLYTTHRSSKPHQQAVVLVPITHVE